MSTGLERHLLAPEAVLLDVDGVLTESWNALPGAPEVISLLRRAGVPFRLLTNTTMFSRRALAQRLRGAGFDVDTEELVTAPVAAAAYLNDRHAGARCFLLGNKGMSEDLTEVELVDDDPDVVLVAGADEEFSYENLNRVFRMLLGGAALVTMHRSLFWTTDEGPTLDAGAFILGLEAAAGVEATVTGKPSAAFFRHAVELLGVPAERVAMVGDDIESDVLAAQTNGLTGVLVRTGKFRPQLLEGVQGEPDLVIDSVADLPALLLPSSYPSSHA